MRGWVGAADPFGMMDTLQCCTSQDNVLYYIRGCYAVGLSIGIGEKSLLQKGITWSSFINKTDLAAISGG